MTKPYYEARQLPDRRWIVASTEGTPVADEVPFSLQRDAEKRRDELEDEARIISSAEPPERWV